MADLLPRAHGHSAGAVVRPGRAGRGCHSGQRRGPGHRSRHTITVLNRRDGRDSPDHLDAWKKTVLDHCTWTQEQTRAQGTEVKEEAAYLVRVPPSEYYRPYGEWKKDMAGFTFSPGDYVIKGEIAEEVTAENVQRVVTKYRPGAFEVRLFRDNTGTGYLDHYRLEGV